MKRLLLILFIPIISWASVTPESLNLSVKQQGALATLDTLNNDDWSTVTEGVASGDLQWFQFIRLTGGVMRFPHTADLREAMTLALIKSPIRTLDFLAEMDRKDISQERGFVSFTSDMVCGIVLLSYTQESYFRIYRKAVSVMESAGKKGQACLKMMRLVNEEIVAEEGRGAVKWGDKVWKG